MMWLHGSWAEPESRIEKLLARLKSKPKDFGWKEFCSVMEHFGYTMGEGSGSRRRFYKSTSGAILFMHQPHPRSILKPYQVHAALQFLHAEGDLS